jgi:undecaprenyl-phosphate 4-deoxy-4-formamido-L-arabinose transferase
LFGLLVAVAGAALAVAFAIERLNNPALPLGWASVVILVLLLAGVQLFALGMLGEYLGRMFLKIGGEPQFVVRRTRNWAGAEAPRARSAGLAAAGNE